jgi:glyoxylase-like metal-dependent hydrolase (beta-lactamase superfamily II)
MVPHELQLLILTHGHWDHIASASDIVAQTGARLAMHQLEKDLLEQSLQPKMPPGVTTWGRMISAVLGLLMPFVHIPAAEVDVVLDDEEYSLAPHGVPGKVLHTPGHSPGSVSVLLDSGQAFVGDLAMNMFPLRLSPGLPIFAEDMRQVRDSWRLLLDQGARTVFPAHGDPFPASVMRAALAES